MRFITLVVLALCLSACAEKPSQFQSSPQAHGAETTTTTKTTTATIQAESEMKATTSSQTSSHATSALPGNRPSEDSQPSTNSSNETRPSNSSPNTTDDRTQSSNTNSTSQVLPTEPLCSNGGVRVGGFCWYLVPNGQNCQSYCDQGRGGYNDATRTYAGSAGTDANCGAVLTALNVFDNGGSVSDAIQNCNTNVGGSYGGHGCYDHHGRYRDRSQPTTATASCPNVQRFNRVCACNQ